MSFLFTFFFVFSQTSQPAANCHKNISAAQLRCNLAIGPIQEVFVYSSNNQLNLCELKTDGSYYARILTQQEWSNKAIQLNVNKPDMMSSTGVLKYQSNDWFYQFRGIYGNADCWIVR